MGINDIFRRFWGGAPEPSPGDSGGTGGARDIFISYARADAKAVDRVLRDLVARGVPDRAIFIDRTGIDGASKWAAVLADAIAECKVLVFFISKASVASEWVLKEVSFAIGESKRLLPLVIEPVDLPRELKLKIGEIHAGAGGAGVGPRRAIPRRGRRCRGDGRRAAGIRGLRAHLGAHRASAGLPAAIPELLPPRRGAREGAGAALGAPPHLRRRGRRRSRDAARDGAERSQLAAPARDAARHRAA